VAVASDEADSTVSWSSPLNPSQPLPPPPPR
jgi:hypothetical protein